MDETTEPLPEDETAETEQPDEQPKPRGKRKPPTALELAISNGRVG